MKYEYKNSIVNVKCSECNSLIMQCDNCLKVFKPNENIICCKDKIKHYCKDCYNKIILKDSIDSFTINPINFILHCPNCDSIIIDCEYCNKFFNEKENVYCNNGETHICEKCYDKIKGDKND